MGSVGIIGCDDSPFIVQDLGLMSPPGDHWLNGEGHSDHNFRTQAPLPKIENVRLHVHLVTNSVATVLLQNAVLPLRFNVLLDGMTNVG